MHYFLMGADLILQGLDPSFVLNFLNGAYLLTTELKIYRGDCGSGGRAGCPLIRRPVVRSPALPVCMSKTVPSDMNAYE